MRRRVFLSGIGATLLCGAKDGEINQHVTALSGDRFKIGDADYALADILAPELFTLDAAAPAYFEDARKALAKLAAEAFDIDDAMTQTRWGVHVATARRRSDGATWQEVLVADGAARVSPASDDHSAIEKLLSLEAEARAAGRGLWAMSAYKVFEAGAARGAIGAYNIVEGTAVTAERHASRLYLNFGEDYRTDFTAGAAGRLATRWAKEGIDLASYAGKKLRVRGFVESINGPSIDLKHPLQVEVLA